MGASSECLVCSVCYELATTKCRARDLGQLSQLCKFQQKRATTVDRTLPIGATVDGT